MMKIDKPYYEDNTRISNSAIGWYLNKGPRYLRDMLDGKEEGLKLPQLEKGTMIHEYILQPEIFWNDYEIADYKVPTTEKQKEFCRLVNESLELLQDDKLSKAYKQVYVTDKMSDEIILVKAKKMYDEYKSYIDSLSKTSKKTITWSDYRMLEQIKKNIAEHKAAVELLDNQDYECHNEFHINWEYHIKETDYTMLCKSLLDRVKIDHVNKRVILIDLKTTSTIYDFKHSVDSFDYYRQMAYYILALTWYFKDLGFDIENYDVEVYIIAISTQTYEIRVFNMLDEQVLSNKARVIVSVLSDLSYNFKNNLWDHTREYYEGTGVEQLT